MGKVITIGREYGSGGREIAETLAKNLSYKYYDKELITLAAKACGYDAKIFERIDETSSNSLLYSLTMGNLMLDSRASVPYTMPLSDKLFMAQSDTIKKLSETENCVIVGRCADFVLRDRPEVVRVFIYADIEYKVERIMHRYNLPRAKAEELIKKTDKKRANYYSFYTNEDWAAMRNYDIVINSAKLRCEDTADMIADFAKRLFAEA